MGRSCAVLGCSIVKSAFRFQNKTSPPGPSESRPMPTRMDFARTPPAALTIKSKSCHCREVSRGVPASARSAACLRLPVPRRARRMPAGSSPGPGVTAAGRRGGPTQLVRPTGNFRRGERPAARVCQWALHAAASPAGDATGDTRIATPRTCGAIDGLDCSDAPACTDLRNIGI